MLQPAVLGLPVPSLPVPSSSPPCVGGAGLRAVSVPSIARPAQREFSLAPRAYPDPKLVHPLASATPRWTSRPERETEGVAERSSTTGLLGSSELSPPGCHLLRGAAAMAVGQLGAAEQVDPVPASAVEHVGIGESKGCRESTAPRLELVYEAGTERPPSGRLSGSPTAMHCRPPTLRPPRPPLPGGIYVR